jgi:hypothetical protein
LLGAIRYTPNHAVLHTDGALMPQRRHSWSSWNYVGEELGRGCAVTYWMNRLQGIASTKPLFVTLNPGRAPAPSSLLWEGEFDHPSYRLDTQRAQRRLWELQGRGGIWFAGAWFGTGFHEDGLQAGLAAAEEMGAVRRPWSVYDESGRIFLPATSPAGPSILAQAA